MAINDTTLKTAHPQHLHSDHHEHVVESAGAVLRRSLFSAVRWGAILAGVAAGVSVQILLTLLGIASGLSMVDVANGNGSAAGPVIWAGISMLVAAFVGGYVAARMSGLKRKTDGLLHGLVSWAVTTLLFAMLAASAGSAIVSGIFSMAPTAMQGAGGNSSGNNSSGNNSSPIASALGAQLGRVDAATMRTLQQQIQAGQRTAAVNELTRSASVDPARAATLVDQALIVAGHPESASPQARASAEDAVRKASRTAWMIFGAVLLALACGVLGGFLGAIGAQRPAWSGQSRMGTASPAV